VCSIRLGSPLRIVCSVFLVSFFPPESTSTDRQASPNGFPILFASRKTPLLRFWSVSEPDVPLFPRPLPLASSWGVLCPFQVVLFSYTTLCPPEWGKRLGPRLSRLRVFPFKRTAPSFLSLSLVTCSQGPGTQPGPSFVSPPEIPQRFFLFSLARFKRVIDDRDSRYSHRLPRVRLLLPRDYCLVPPQHNKVPPPPVFRLLEHSFIYGGLTPQDLWTPSGFQIPFRPS